MLQQIQRSELEETKLRTVILALSLFIMAACATPIPFSTVSVGGQPSVVSDKTAKLVLVTGAVRGSQNSMLMPAGGIYVPVSTGEVPKLQFNESRQKGFMEVLRSELVRLQVFRAVDTAPESAGSPMTVTVLFAQTFHTIQNQEYVLDVAMEITGGKEPFLGKYRVNSYEGESLLKKWSTNAYQGQVLAVRKLLQVLIPDIQKYVAANA